MIFDNELKLLCETFKRSRVAVTMFSPETKGVSMTESEYLVKPDQAILTNMLEGGFIDKMNHKTLYKITNQLGLKYTFFLINFFCFIFLYIFRVFHLFFSFQ